MGTPEKSADQEAGQPDPGEPGFEVVVAAYGPSPYLADTLESAVSTLPAEIRITVLDDASPDDSVADVAVQFAPRVRYLRNPKNLGTSGSFNEAMRISKAKYTVLLGPDDLLLPGAARVYGRAIAEHDGVAVIHPGVLTINGAGAPAVPLADRVKHLIRPRPGSYSGPDLALRLLLGNWTYNPAIAWRTDLVDEYPYDETLRTAMDIDRLLRLAFAGESLLLIEEAAFIYRRHEGAVSSVNRGQQRLGEELEVHARACVKARELGWYTTYAAAVAAPTARSHGLQVALGAGQAHVADRWATVRLALHPIWALRPGRQGASEPASDASGEVS